MEKVVSTDADNATSEEFKKLTSESRKRQARSISSSHALSCFVHERFTRPAVICQCLHSSDCPQYVLHNLDTLSHFHSAMSVDIRTCMTLRSQTFRR